ncbi:hypothetical protein [Halodesulfovibrio sp.]|uniref:hypothetical protein n=1 Tax=Halodesulfovibrio sp. TaxID=1912772 RepID=UPI0025C49B1D|nr:hypothetical protein [Halodesulfovibrio sp.]
MLKKKQRTIVSHIATYQFSGKSLWSIPKDITVLGIVERLKKQLEQIKAIRYTAKSGTVAFFLEQLVITDDNNFAVLLFSMCDQNGVDQATGNLTEKKITVHRKNTEEGNAYSCHLVLTLKPDPKGMYYAFREYVPGLTDKFLAAIINKESSKLLGKQYCDDNGRKSFSYPSISFRALPSDRLLTDIQNGRLSFIELVKSKPHKQLDRITEQTTEIKTLKVELAPQEDLKTLEQGLKRILQKTSPDEAKFRFKDSEKTYSVSVRGDEDISDFYFAKKKEVKVSKDIDQASDFFHGELMHKMLHLAKVETGIGRAANEAKERSSSFSSTTVSQHNTA